MIGDCSWEAREQGGTREAKIWSTSQCKHTTKTDHPFLSWVILWVLVRAVVTQQCNAAPSWVPGGGTGTSQVGRKDYMEEGGMASRLVTMN